MTPPGGTAREPSEHQGRQRRFHVDGTTLELRLDGLVHDELARRLDRVLAGYRPTSSAPDAWLSIAADDQGFTIESGTNRPASLSGVPLPYQELVRVADPDYTLFALDDWVDQASLLFGEPGALRLHAACFVLDGECWVVAGPSYAGKSTIALQAVLDGAQLLTDERTAVRDGKVQGLGRPLRLRTPIDLLPSDLRQRFELEVDVSRTLLCFDSRAHRRTDEWRRADRLLLLTDLGSEQVSVGSVARTLVELSMNIAVMGIAGLVEAARLASCCAVHLGRPRGFQSVRRVGPPVLVPSRSPVDPGIVDPPDPEVGGGFRLLDGVRTVTVGNECLIWIPGPPGAVLGLAGTNATAWNQVVTGRANLDAPELDSLARGLATVGVLGHT